jgi:hypothetical protein
MNRKIVNCPHCGKILSEDIWKGTNSTIPQTVKYPQCGSKTPESKNLLEPCEGTVFPARLYRFDKCQVAYEILAVGLVPENFKKGGDD